MAEIRDYEHWHEQYDDPDSGLSRRLAAVRRVVGEFLDARPGPVRILSACAGDGRDVLGVLAGRADRERVEVTLVELNPALADRARMTAAEAGIPADVRTADAGVSDSYAGAVPADLVLLVGIFGNISRSDIERTARAAPQLCAPGATLVWSRGRRDQQMLADIRGWFAAAGFGEQEIVTIEAGEDATRTLGVQRFDGPAEPLEVGARLFTFVR